MDAFGVQGYGFIAASILLAPIYIPFGLFWILIDLIFITIPDFLFVPRNIRKNPEAHARAMIEAYDREQKEKHQRYAAYIRGEVNSLY